MYPLTPTHRMEASILIAGRVANRAKTLHHHLSSTIGDQTQAPPRFSNHRTPGTTHLPRLHPSIPPLVRVLVAGKTAKDRLLVVRTVPVPHHHRGQIRRALQRGQVTTRPDLHLRPTSDLTTDTLLPRPQPRPSPLDQMDPPPLRALLRITSPLRRPLPRPHGLLNRHHCLKGTIP